MGRYRDLDEKFTTAKQSGQITQFISQLNTTLQSDPSDRIGWLFAAYAYELENDIDNAASSYARFLQLADPHHPFTYQILIDIQKFVDFHGRLELVDIALDRLGPGRLKPSRGPNSNSAASASTEPVTSVAGIPNQIDHQPSSRGLVLASDSSTLMPKSTPGIAISDNTSEQPQNTQIAEVLANAKKAFHDGELSAALSNLKKAYGLGDRSPQMLLMLAQTLQRLGRLDEALQYLDVGIKSSKSDQKLALINLKAQIYSSQGQLDKAAQTYETLIRLERRSAAVRFSRLELARIYRKQRKFEQARDVLDWVLTEYPQDQVALRLRSALDAATSVPPLDTASQQSAIIQKLEVDLSDDDIDLISPMLRRDLATTEFRDETILRRGGQPQVTDADRLLQQGESAVNSEFGERYPIFLEAAKAYNQLPPGSFDLEKFHKALTRYAMLKGGAIVSEFRRLMLSGQADLLDLRRLRDSATSYYLESLALQVHVDVNYALIPLTNYLRIQVTSALAEHHEQNLSGLFEMSFSDLFRFCLEHSNPDIARIAYESVVAYGAASGSVWNKLQNLSGGPGILGLVLERQAARRRPYQILSDVSGLSFDVSQRPGEVLRAAFLERRQQIQKVFNFFSLLQRTALSILSFRDIYSRCQDFPAPRGVLFDTDIEILKGVNAILAALLPYQSRSPEERTAILFTARTNVEQLLSFIQENPTYWGRVGFEPLLLRWQHAIRSIEQQRLTEIQPRIEAILEPPVFHLENSTTVVGGLKMQNSGLGTAEGVTLTIRLTLEATEEMLFEIKDKVVHEIAVRSAFHYPIHLPVSKLSNGLHFPYRLQIEIAPIFRQAELDSTLHDFTLEVHKGIQFALEDIPWNEMKIPPEQLFKGREEFIERLYKHLRSPDRNKTYILYGLTRTGKSSILRYLSRRIDFQPLKIDGEVFRFVSFEWDMAKAKANSSAQDMWGYLLREAVVGKIERMVAQNLIDADAIPQLRNPESLRFREWEPILSHLQQKHLYPVFLLDEFSYYREMVNSKRIDASFLAAIRSYAINDQASFVFAGTYDLRKLIEDPAYGITGQFVNAIETQVSQIEQEPAIELIQVMEPKLHFTPDAIEYILQMSYQVPYFIQLLCKSCALYALETTRSIVGFPEVETVVRLLTSEADLSGKQMIRAMPPGIFMNNMHAPTDPIEYGALLSTICDLTRGQIQPRMITYPEIQEVWDRHGVRLFQARLAQAVQELCDREVLVAGEDEGIPAYRISVDLFRRWWANEHKYLNVELDAVKREV
jgi:tetratricopeptide (TPR) repeat protein